MVLSSVLCLALNIYGEARGEPLEGQIAVAEVTMNRVEHPAYPDSVCAVVFQKNQFSWTQGQMKIQEPKAFLASFFLAGMVLVVPPEDMTNGATHFVSGRQDPDWTNRLTKVAVIGKHRFFRDMTRP